MALIKYLYENADYYYSFVVCVHLCCRTTEMNSNKYQKRMDEREAVLSGIISSVRCASFYFYQFSQVSVLPARHSAHILDPFANHT